LDLLVEISAAAGPSTANDAGADDAGIVGRTKELFTVGGDENSNNMSRWSSVSRAH
jgi:hypothetical protein